MFTGLIEKIGTLAEIRKGASGAVLRISHEPWDMPLKPGDSIAVQGACLTVTEVSNSEFVCDVLDETLERTSLPFRKAGAPVNLERALNADGRLGGHFVSAHVDGTGTVTRLQTDGTNRVLEINCGTELAKEIIEKGSIACDGVSLTVTAVTSNSFTVKIIPFTWDRTSLHALKEGDIVNVEADMLGKYVRRCLQQQGGQKGLSMDNLRDAGFI